MSCGLPPPSLPPSHLSFRFMSSTATGEGSCLIRRLVAIFFPFFVFFFMNTFVHGRWFSVYSSCKAEQMDTGWHLRITPRNDDLLQSPCPSFFFFFLWPQAAECVGTRPTAVPLYTDPLFSGKPPVSPTNGLSGAKERENKNKKWIEPYSWMKYWVCITIANPIGF